MKKVISLIAVLSMAFPAFAEDVDVTFSGDFRTRGMYEMVQGLDEAADDRNDNAWSGQFRIGSAWNAGEKLSGQVSFLANTQWGGDAEGRALNSSDFEVYEAFATWLMSDTTKIRVGRGVYTVADGTVVAENLFEDLPYSFDGAIYTNEMDWARMDVFFARMADLRGDTNSTFFVADPAINANVSADLGNGESGDHTDVFGVNFDLKILPDMFNMSNVHIMQVKRDSIAAANATTVDGTTIPVGSPVPITELPSEDYIRYGLTLGGDIAGFDFRGTYAGYSGDVDDGDLEGSMIDVELGYEMKDMMGARFHVLHHIDSGDEDATDDKSETYDSFFYDLHQNAGLMDVVRWGNSTYTQVGLTLEPKDDLTLDIRYIMFEKTEEADAANLANITAAAGAGSDTDLGSEIDIELTQKYESGLAISARYGMFMPGDAFATDDTYSQFWLQASMSF